MTSYKVTRLRLDDLESAVITCKKCKAQVSLLLGTREQVPELCPACRTPFEQTLRNGLVALLTFYVNLGDLKMWPNIEIQIRTDAEERTKA